jgi:thioredoxin 1
MPTTYLSETEAPERASVKALPGLTLLEFGTGWCGHCVAAQTLVAQALAMFPQWQHLKIEDGSGRPLGRSFRVTLWPTLIFCVTVKSLPAWCDQHPFRTSWLRCPRLDAIEEPVGDL